MRHTRAISRLVVVGLIGLGLAGAACSNNALPGATGDASADKTGTAGSGAAGQTGAAGSGSAGTRATGAAGTASGGPACGATKCVAGGTCCFACISLCAGPGEQCPVFIQDPCSTARDAGVDAPAGQACSDKGPACPAGQVCDLSQPGRCAASTAGGTCIKKPAACDLIYAPVCGCDGKTYGNDCERQSAGAQLDHTGACAGGCGSMTCGAGQTCVHPCCGGAPPPPGQPACTPPPPFCTATTSCKTTGNNTCCFSDGGAGCCGLLEKGGLGLSCQCA